MINDEQISRFLEGRNSQKYIVNVEIPYGADKVSLVINDPVKGKYVSKDNITSFVWFKESVTKKMYAGNRNKIKQACKKFGVKISRLKTTLNNEGIVPRMDDGFKFIAKCEGPYGKLLTFFKQGGIDVYGESDKRNFVAINPIEQYLIASGKRLFKGFDDYDDIHRFQFDLETTGLKPKGDLLSREEIEDVKQKMAEGKDVSALYEFDEKRLPIRHKDSRIFQIGVKDNRGYEDIIEIKTGPDVDDREQELFAIFKFFEVIKKLKPDTIAGYNSENFDWDFIFTRCDVLGVDIELVAKTLDSTGEHKIKRVDKSLKLGGEREYYKQTTMWGYNIIDVYHAVRRAKAINSNIKSAGLKYITKYANKNKPNRVYVDGGKIYSMWADNVTDYAFNDVDGTYYRITEEKPLEEGYELVKGKTIIRRYLLDDLWETEQVDAEFNQAAFLLSKLIPTSYMRSTTMGTAGIWKLIMLAWSYENRLAIPDVKERTRFTGGLSRLLEVGYRTNVVKLDFAALYPNIEITWDIFPDTDISDVMKGMLLYIANTRDKFKGLMNKHKSEVRELQEILDDKGDLMTKEELEFANKQLKENKSLASMYDKKQLPIKILGNSFFGSLGAPNIFNWGDIECAEETTCRGRQYLRLMVWFFVDKGFTPLVGDTDGFNFAIPDDVDKFRYTPKGTHRFTENKAGKESTGLDAVVDEYNELYMIGRMGLDIDDICESTINFSRKNYANLIDGKIKLVGNTIKSSKMPIYIEEFLAEAIEYLLKGKGYEFVQLYNKTVEDIYNFRVPLVKIASKANVKETIPTYIKESKTKTKAGNYKARKAHMELAIKNDVNIHLGDTIYYVNTGKVKSHGDVKVTTDKETGERTVDLNCMMIPAEQIENNPNLTTDEYNVPKYLSNFNKRIKPLLVCFKPEIRDDILVDMVKNKKTKEMELTDFKVFTKSQCELSNGTALKDGDQDDYDTDLMQMDDKEIQFWLRNKKIPNNLDDLQLNWEEVVNNYNKRKENERIKGIKYDKDMFLSTTKRLEIDEINTMKNTSEIPKQYKGFAKFDVHNDKNGNPNIFVKSIKWDVDLGTVEDIIKYEPWAMQRANWYLNGNAYKKDKNFEGWLKHLWIEAKLGDEDKKADKIEKELNLCGIEIDVEDYNKLKKLKVKS